MVDVIAIDGPASVGKSSLTKKLSLYFDSPALHSGKLYRAIAYEILQKKINLSDKNKILKCAKTLDEEQIESQKLYTSEVGKISSLISTKKYLRDKLKHFQRNYPNNYAKDKKFAIIEGRDIGTVIFPSAKYKIFMDAKTRQKGDIIK